MKGVSFAVLAVAAALYGCATTESQDSSTSAGTPSAGKPSASTSTGSPSGGQVGSRSAATSGGPGAASGMQRPDMKRSVYYEFDKYDVKPEYRTLVESHARWLKANPQAKLVIEGNADERGSREYNVALGQRRAESVTKMLMLLGAKADQIEAVSWGEEKPRSGGHDESSWSENRRADFASR
ncbi:MAG TPA: peptidoglycan-associated lipoprotein Pal [Burkholderiales bacterium]|jgi:peptidoglycan-associated lipoprotein|nr:peptidoglycan-associated lipoprotein Pal [Burkholderiales bacterium]